MQDAIRQELHRFKMRIDAAAGLLKTVRETTGMWTREWFADRQRELVCVIAADSSMATTCPNSAVPGAGLTILPAGSLAALQHAIGEILKIYEGLPKGTQQSLKERLDIVADNQRALGVSLASLQEAQAVLRQAADVIRRIDASKVQPYAERVFVATPNGTDRVATIKLSARDVLTRESAALTTVVVRWGGTRWEASGGVLFSAIANRTFANAPIIEDGVPRVDASGKVYTRLTETVTRPSVVPMALASFRLAESELAGRRIAVLASGGIGVSPYSGSADFTAGVTIAYRGLMVSPVLHWGRAQRLTSGLKPGLELGSNPPALTTERYWLMKSGVVLSYRIPIN